MDYSHYLLGCNPSTKDVNDYRLGAFMPLAFGDLSGEILLPFNHDPLNQDTGNENTSGHCCGFGGTDFEINVPVEDQLSNQDGHDLYYLCKEIDLEPKMENGSSVRSVARALQIKGRIGNYAWAHTTDEIVWWLLNKQNPIVLGTNWYTGMFETDSYHIIHPTGQIEGGHCTITNAKVNHVEDINSVFFRIQNSWGDWGEHGAAWLCSEDLAQLMAEGGEAMTSVELPLGTLPTPQSKGCNFILSQILATLGKNKV